MRSITLTGLALVLSAGCRMAAEAQEARGRRTGRAREGLLAQAQADFGKRPPMGYLGEVRYERPW